MEERAREQLARYREVAPGWGAPWDVEGLGEEGFDRLCDALAGLPCPALEPATGACLLYHGRPSTCRIMGSGLVTPEGEVLANLCPIQDEHPDYAAEPPTPFDLGQFERQLEDRDAVARERGAVRTTIAGALG